MLLDFSFTNYRLYKSPAYFTMASGRFKSFEKSLIPIPGQRTAKMLPMAAIYGGNASGKTTFIHAIKCIRSIVLSGKINQVEPFRLDEVVSTQSTEFCICFAAQQKVWEYSIALTKEAVEKESLYDVTTKVRKCIFDRTIGECKIGRLILKSDKTGSVQFAQIMGENLPASEVFLFNIVKLKIKGLLPYVLPCYEWFDKTLCIISADSRRVGLSLDLFAQLPLYSEALANADTGVESLKFCEVDVKNVVPDDVLEKFKESDDNVLFASHDASLLLIKRGKDDIKAVRCHSVHTSEAGNKITFPLSNESDGTRRYLHLLPMLLDTSGERVYVIDELDRSLHTRLSASLIKHCRNLIASGKQKLQLIFTTHDVMLMDDENFRKDEIWATERDAHHAAHIMAFSDFKNVRADIKMRNSYLEGRMGGLPNIDCCL